jgi:hypothetical protein
LADRVRAYFEQHPELDARARYAIAAQCPMAGLTTEAIRLSLGTPRDSTRSTEHLIWLYATNLHGPPIEMEFLRDTLRAWRIP